MIVKNLLDNKKYGNFIAYIHCSVPLSLDSDEVGQSSNQKCDGIYSAFWVHLSLVFERWQKECLFAMRVLADNCTQNTQIKNTNVFYLGYI